MGGNLHNRFFLGALMACSVCWAAETPGILVARFDDGLHSAPKRIHIPAPGVEKELKITVGSRKRSCEVSLVLPSDPTSGNAECDHVAAPGMLSCSDGRKLNLDWVMTSCHSGFGRSVGNGEPTFAFGFSGYLDGALDQLETARTKLISESRIGVEKLPPDPGSDYFIP